MAGAQGPLLLSKFSFPLFPDNEPLQIVVPAPGNPTMIREFRHLASWRGHVLGLRLRGDAPLILQQKHDRVLQLLFLAWIDPNIVKFAELCALATLEATVSARYPEAGVVEPIRASGPLDYAGQPR